MVVGRKVPILSLNDIGDRGMSGLPEVAIS